MFPLRTRPKNYVPFPFQMPAPVGSAAVGAAVVVEAAVEVVEVVAAVAGLAVSNPSPRMLGTSLPACFQILWARMCLCMLM